MCQSNEVLLCSKVTFLFSKSSLPWLWPHVYGLQCEVQLLSWASPPVICLICTSRITSAFNHEPPFSSSTRLSAGYTLNECSPTSCASFKQSYFLWSLFFPCLAGELLTVLGIGIMQTPPLGSLLPMFSHPFPEPFGHISGRVMITLHDTYGH